MRPLHLFSILALALLLVAAPLLQPILAEEAGEEEESIAEIIERSNMTPALRETVIELFEHLHLLEGSFRNEQWEKASREVDQIDHFYSKVLQLSEEMKSKVELSYLQAFEFSLAEINRGIKRRDRELVESRFLELQPELFDILDRFTVIPLRLTASRFYIDLAINALKEGRFDIALDELGEISEYMEQLEQTLTSRGLDMASLHRQLSQARQQLQKKQGPTSKQALEEIRRSLEQFFQNFAIK
ncbi:MAG: hypothetical protein OEY01_09335 [Desulfobulbaceae bacterium]|nr:hypothetical protein [Desulfobulbaceae bacterium]HIJ79206.1 hypothetical protein [Deltaproteobacteria bacterium]